MLSDDIVRQLANGEGGIYHFDLSVIANEFYEPLLRTLQHFAQKKVDSLGFTCDELQRAEQRALAGHQMPVNVLNSIAKTKSHYIRNVVELVVHVLPRSTRIREITLSNLSIRKDQWLRIATAMGRSTSLHNINLTRIQIGNDGLQALLTSLDPNQIETISISYCGLSDASLVDIIAFIEKKNDDIAKGGGIRVFSVSKTEFNDDSRRQISEALGTYVATPKKPSPKKIAEKQKRSQQKAFQRDKEIEELKQLEQENLNLKQELLDLRQSVDAVQYNDDVFIVGKNAEHFIQFITEVESKIKALEAQKEANGGML